MKLRSYFYLLCLAAKSSYAADQKPLFSHHGPVQPFPSLIDVSLSDLMRGLQQGLFNSVDLTKAYIKRIDEVNDDLHVVTELNPDALDIAAALDHERASGQLKGPLHGIPILLKDNIATADKMNNTAGSLLLVGAKVPRDATVVEKLRDAGAVVLGKVNLGEWAQARGNVTNGWSAYGGQTYGAYAHKQDPSGSSSGSGVASDLGLAFATLGTETSGSIIQPADINNVVGIKPTVGLASRHMVVPVCDHRDTVGPLARTVKDAAMILQVIAGVDRRDNFTSAIPDIPDYVAACRMDALDGARLGVPWNILDGCEPGEMEAFRQAISALEAAGATIVPAEFTSPERLSEGNSSFTFGIVDQFTSIPRYLAELTYNPHDIHTMQDIRDKMRSMPSEMYPHYSTSSFDSAIELGYNTSDPRWWAAQLEVQRICGPEGIYGAMDAHNLDALITPSSKSSRFAAYIGSPIVGVPMGYFPEGTEVRWDDAGEVVVVAPGIPIGLSFMGRRWEETTLIGLAYAYEQRTTIRAKAPKRVVQPTTELLAV